MCERAVGERQVVVVLTYGTFDLFHRGHVELLKRARCLGDKLVVYVSSDKFCLLKGKVPVLNAFDRQFMVCSCVFVSRVVEETCWLQKLEDVELWKAMGYEVKVVMGDDWRGKFDNLPCEVIYLPRTEGISTTIIRGRVWSEKRR